MLNDVDINQQYDEAVKDALINNTNIKNSNKKGLLIFGLSFVGLVSFFGYNYYLKGGLDKTQVMGVAHSSGIKQSDILSDSNKSSSKLIKYINNKLENKSSENKEKRAKKDIVIVVKQGDTLTTIAKKYYNDSTAYEKIIETNKELSKKSYVIYPGQKLIIPDVE
ncbi:MAG: LysM peptidoglycan-binding domain-containing protein [Epsilonproteobacteria bacterium]|nr:LysM peptidoglycan-binding domain-containing protein [Campylobacterota bacterium]